MRRDFCFARQRQSGAYRSIDAVNEFTARLQYHRAMDLKSAIKSIGPTIVQIRAISSEKNDPLGTGFLINEDAHVVTAKHVIDSARQLGAKVGSSLHLGVGLAHENTESMRANFTIVGFELVAEDEAHDLALLKLAQNPFKGEVSTGIVIGDEALPLPHGHVTFDNRPPAGRRADRNHRLPPRQPCAHHKHRARSVGLGIRDQRGPDTERGGDDQARAG